MGNICADDSYKQIKQLYPVDFMRFVVDQELAKQVEAKCTAFQSKVLSAAENIKKDNLNTIDLKHKEIQQHFQQVKTEVDESYPGGISFLESSKQAKLEELLGLNAVTKQFNDIKEHLKNQYAKEQEKVNQTIDSLKQTELQKIKKETPEIQYYHQLTDKAKEGIYKSGQQEFKSQIQTQNKQFFRYFDQKFKADSFIDRFTGLLPLNRLQSLVLISKEDISKKAQGFIGTPGEGKAVLY